MKDPYEVLGVARDADEKRIKEAYRRLARQYHPDVNPGDKDAEERFKDIQVAYDLLSDADKRRTYDRFGETAFSSGSPPPGRKSGAPFPGFGIPSFDEIFGAGSLHDILSGLFGGRASPGPAPASSSRVTIDVSFEEAYRGVERDLSIVRERPCPGCKGTGRSHSRAPQPCGSCGGRALVAERERVRIRIPAGIDEGGTLRVPLPDGEELFLTVRVRPDPRFERRHSDLHVEVPISLTEAALGGEVEIPTPDGQARIRIPAGSPSGRKIRLSGRGMPAPRGPAGDLYVSLRIVPPPTLSDEERLILERFAAISPFHPRKASSAS